MFINGVGEIEVIKVIEKLREYGYFSDSTRVGTNQMVTCPFHKDGMESNPSFGIHLQTGVCRCLTAHCDWRGNLISLIKELLKVDGKQWLIEVFVYKTGGARRQLAVPKRGTVKEGAKTIPIDVITKYTRNNRPALDYLSKRGINGVDKIFLIGYNEYRNSVMFFIRNIDGSIGYVKQRNIETKRFHNTAGAHKSDFVYGLYESTLASAKVVWICESETDALTLWGWGIPAVSIAGSAISERQVELLSLAGIRCLIDGLDRDGAGRAGFNLLKQMAHIRVIETKWEVDKKDINELTEEEFRTKVLTIK